MGPNRKKFRFQTVGTRPNVWFGPKCLQSELFVPFGSSKVPISDAQKRSKTEPFGNGTLFRVSEIRTFYGDLLYLLTEAKCGSVKNKTKKLCVEQMNCNRLFVLF